MINKIAFLLLAFLILSVNVGAITADAGEDKTTTSNVMIVLEGTCTDETEVTECSWTISDLVNCSTANPVDDGPGTTVTSSIEVTCTDSASPYTATLTGKDGVDSDVTDDAIITVNANEAPVVSNVEISPTNPKTSDDLICNYDYTDTEDDPDASTIVWSEGETPTGETSQTLDSSKTAKGESWKCEVTPAAASGTSPGTAVESSEVIIENSAPESPSLIGTPNSGEPPLEVTFTGSCFDADDDIVSCKINFYYTSGDTNLGIDFTDGMSYTYSNIGIYTAMLTVTDEENETITSGETIDATNANQAPVASVQITPPSPTTGDGLTCDYSYSDAEGDPKGTAIFLWYKDGAPTGNTSQTLGSGNTSNGDDWICQVTPIALTGTSPGEDVNSDPVTVGGVSRPTISSSSHDEDVWESSDDPEFSWSSVTGATYYYVFNTSSGTVPDTGNYSKTGTSMSYSNQSNGTHYFHVRARVGDEWSSADHYEIKIDDEKPDKPEYINVNYDEDDDDIDLSWDESDDDYSGIDYYEVYRGTNSDFDDMERQATNTDRSYSEDDLVDGKRYYYRVRAKDNAGNYSTESDYVSVVFGEEDQRPKPTVEWTEPDDDDVVSGVIELEARAIADSATSIRNVRFYNGNNLLGYGEKSGSYYTFDWNTLAEDDGDYELKAISLDWYGISSNPDKIDVTVDNVPETDGVRADAQAAIDEADDAKEAAASLFADFDVIGASPSSEAASLLSDGSLQLEDAQDLFDDEDYEGAEEKALQAKEKFDELLEMLSIEEYGEGQEYVYNEEHLELLLKGLGFSQGLVDEVKEMVEDYTVGRSLSVKAVKEKYSRSYRAVITVSVKNNLDEEQQIKLIEVIPKELAESASLIGGEGFEVVVEDPVLQWQLQLGAGEEAEIVYFLKDDLTAEEAGELLESAVLSKFAVPPVLAKPDTEIAAESFSGAAVGLFGLGAGLEWLGWIVLAVIVVAVALLAFNYLRGMEREGSGLGSGMPRTGSGGGFFGRLRPGKREEEPQGPKWQYRG